MPGAVNISLEVYPLIINLRSGLLELARVKGVSIMPSVINTNVNSLLAQRNLSSTQSTLETSLARLSSGLRINSAKDDAAGLAIANRFSSQIRGLDQAARNANDGISLAQTAEGGLNNVATNLQRLRELSVQAANGSLTDVDRESLNLEAKELISEIDRIAKETSFNGVKLLDGSASQRSLHVGANANQTIEFSLSSATIDKLGVSDSVSVSSVNTSSSQAQLQQGDLVLNGVTVGASFATYDTASSTGAAQSAIAKAAAINAVSEQSGVTAQVNENVLAGGAMSAAGAATSGSITVNGVSISVTVLAGDTAGTRAGILSAINAKSGQTGVVATDSGLDGTGLILTAKDGRNINVSFGTVTSAQTGVQSGTAYGTFNLVSDKDIVVQQGSGSLERAGLGAGTYAKAVSSLSTVDNNGTAFTAGDLKINGVLVGATLASMDTSSTASATGSAIAKVAAINAVSEQTGVTATVNANVADGSAMTAAAVSGTITINGVATSTFLTDGSDNSISRKTTIDAINAISARTGVVAVDSGTSAGGVKLQALDGRNVVVSLSGITSAASGVTAGTSYGTYTLQSAKAITVDVGSNGTSGLANAGLNQGVFGAVKSGIALSDVDLSTVDGANNAISAIDNALASVDKNRSGLGAIQNRLTSTITNLQVTSENLTAAKSRIQDADFAKETAALTRSQILQQAGVSILSQANQLPQLALSLLQ